VHADVRVRSELKQFDKYRNNVNMSKTRIDLTIFFAADSGPADDRRNAILAAALDLFMRYGFSRVTMDDIAQAAGLSRPLLYREFKNKADIYAAITAVMLRRAQAAAETALADKGGIEERLDRALAVGLLDLADAISQSPHGDEILDMKDQLTAAVHSEWRDGMIAALATAIDGEARARGIDLSQRGFSAHALADTLIDGIEGVKHRTDDPTEWRAAAKRLTSLVVLTLK